MVGNLLKWTILFLEIGIYTCEEKLKLVTVVTHESDGYQRFMRSAKVNKLDVEVFGLDEESLGADMAKGPGVSHKLTLLRESLKKYKDDNNLILMFTDSHDVVLASGEKEIVEKFKKTGANVLISAEDSIWSDRSLADRYPKLREDGYSYLCSDGIIGYAPSVYELLSLKAMNDTDDERLYYTRIYLDSREKYNIKLDRRAELFQKLNGNKEHVEVTFEGSDVRVTNTRFKTKPVVIHGDGPSNIILNYFGNYVPKHWTQKDGCLGCGEDTIKLESVRKEDWPTVLVSVHISNLTPFLDAFLHHVSSLDYPKNKIDVFIHSAQDFHGNCVEEWIKEFDGQYNSVTYKGHKMFLNDQQGKNMGMFHWKKIKTDYYFTIGSAVTLSNNRTLQLLIQQNRTILAPMLSKHKQFWSNFWGDISSDGYYVRSADYLDIVKNVRRGVWNSPYISDSYLINSSVIDKIGVDPFHPVDYDTNDMQFCANLRKKGLFMYVTNLHHFGHLKEMDTYNTKYKHNDLYQLFDNKLDWEDKYLHPEYTAYLSGESKIPQPCPDVFWVPIATAAFAKELIEECEHFGQWSGGKHKDERIAGGYENVPTVDIHMNQIGFEKGWLHMLKEYFSPYVSHLFTGYVSKNKSYMNFVVKYTMTGQYFLRPHHDASTYTINLALNRAGIDYTGGGVHFNRHNCSVRDTKVGWALLNAGRLTHQHEGLPLKSGTRYIMISFVDP